MSADNVTAHAEVDTLATRRAERQAAAAQQSQTMDGILAADPECMRLREAIATEEAKVSPRHAAVVTAKATAARLKRARKAKLRAADDGDKAAKSAVAALQKQSATAAVEVEDAEVLVEVTIAHLRRLQEELRHRERVAFQRALAEEFTLYIADKVAIEAALASVGALAKAFDRRALFIMDLMTRVTGKSPNDRVRCKLSLKETINGHVLGEFVEPWARDFGVGRSGAVRPFDQIGEGDEAIRIVLSMDLTAPAADDSDEDEPQPAA